VLIDKKQTVDVAPLASKVYLQLPIEQAGVADRSNVFVAADLTSGASVISSNIIYLAPTVEVHLPPAPLKTELTKTSGGYKVRVTSPVLARDVYINFGELDADVSDNYFDLLPGQSAEVTIKTNVAEDALRGAMKVISLVDAFPATTSASHQSPVAASQ
jgi:beta-mannosidase